MFGWYSFLPIVIKLSSATSVNLGTLTADLYSLFFGIFLFHYKVSYHSWDTQLLTCIGGFKVSTLNFILLALITHSSLFFRTIFPSLSLVFSKPAHSIQGCRQCDVVDFGWPISIIWLEDPTTTSFYSVFFCMELSSIHSANVCTI